MPGDRHQDDAWVRRALSGHADGHELDLEAFVDRVLAEADSRDAPTSRGAGARTPSRAVRAARADRADVVRPDRGRLTPVLVAAAVVVLVAVTGTTVSLLARGTTRAASPAVTGSTPAPGPGPRSSAPSAGHSAPVSEAPTGLGTAVSTQVSPPATARPGTTLASTFGWSSGAPVISARTTAAGVTGQRDPSVVRYGGAWHVFTTLLTPSGYDLGYQRFTDWSRAGSAPVHALSRSAIGGGFRSAPQVFWLAPQKLWYLVYQTGIPSYSTNPDINDPNGWTAPKPFYDAVPDLVTANLAGGFWVSPWVVCDASSCYLFSSDNRGHLFRSRTSAAAFPLGMSRPVIAAQGSGDATTFAAARVYTVAGTDRFLLTAQAFGPDGKGYLKSWTAGALDGAWTPLADTAAHPFAGPANLAFTAGSWADAIVAGELVRDGHDQTFAVNPCHLQLLALGLDPRYQDNRSTVIGLLTATSTTCS